MKRMLLVALLLPLLAQANDGAWSASARGPALSNAGVQASSQPLTANEKINGAITLVYWRYELNGPAPAGLQARLCSSQRCVALEGASGVTRGLTNVSADEPLRFIFGVEGSGQLKRVLRVLSADVMVNYRGAQ